MQKIFIIIFMLLFVFVCFSQDNKWELKKEQNDIKVYTRKIEGSNFDEFKGVGIIYAGISPILQRLKDVEDMAKWVPDCKKVLLLEQTENNKILYIETTVPFPFQNRDMAYNFKYTYPEGTKNVKIIITGLPDYIPPKDDIVRMPRSEGYWFLEYINENKTKATYQLHADPGGNIPSWLANQKVIDTPYGTLEELKKMVE